MPAATTLALSPGCQAGPGHSRLGGTGAATLWGALLADGSL